MQSRRDQVQAHSFMVGRLSAALVAGDPDGLESPHRRLAVGSLVGVLLAVLLVAGFAVFGLIRPGGATSWREPGVVIVEKETGTRFFLVRGRLRPALNYASILLLSAETPKVVRVSAASLRGVPHGQPIGIPGAPDAIPPAGDGVNLVWNSCAQVARDQSGSALTATTLAIGRPSALNSAPAPADRAVVVRVAGGDTFLLWQGRRHRVAESWIPRVLRQDTPIVVDTRWLDNFPVGPDVAAVAVPRRGERGPRVDGRETRIGELFADPAEAGTGRMFVLQADGLSPLSPFAETLLAGDPATAALYQGRPVAPSTLSPAALSQLGQSRIAAVVDGLPEAVPLPAQTAPGRTWCVQHGARDRDARLVAAEGLGDGDMVTDTASLTRTSSTAMAVRVEPGRGGLFRVGRPDQAPGADLFLVTDAGLKFPVADGDAAARLGHPATTAVAVPRTFLELLPTGRTLSRSAAGR
ncbi:type VII secretion protein EccB [Micromonospora sp. NPDC050200]|uniref:type VII secretion protein EccB n=1 Tax=Micromonospora sp. NPDC050200 TaxID=3155664 RepID=UPI0033D6771D